MISLSHEYCLILFEYCLNELFISPLTIEFLNIDVGGGGEVPRGLWLYRLRCGD